MLPKIRIDKRNDVLKAWYFKGKVIIRAGATGAIATINFEEGQSRINVKCFEICL